MEQNKNINKKKGTEIKLKPFTRAVRERIIEKYKNKPRTPEESTNLINELCEYTRNYIVIGGIIEELDFPLCYIDDSLTMDLVRIIKTLINGELQRKLRRLSEAMFNDEKAVSACMEIIACTERIATLARELPLSLGMKNAEQEVNKVVRREIKIIVEQTKEGWLKVKLPFLLPKKEKGSNEYLRDILYCALQDYFNDREPIKFDHSVIVIKHVYGKERKDRMRCDHDNFEINFITDAIALFALPDDSPEHCKMFSYSERGEKEHSCIYLIPENDFIKYCSQKVMRK